MEGQPRGCDRAGEDDDELDCEDRGLSPAAAEGYGEGVKGGAEEDVEDVDSVAQGADPTEPGGGQEALDDSRTKGKGDGGDAEERHAGKAEDVLQRVEEVGGSGRDAGEDETGEGEGGGGWGPALNGVPAAASIEDGESAPEAEFAGAGGEELPEVRGVRKGGPDEGAEAG